MEKKYRKTMRLLAYNSSSDETGSKKLLQEILLDTDQSNVLLVRIIFSGILQSAFSFLLTCIRDPASI